MQTEEMGGSAAAAARLLDPQPKGSQQLPFMKPEDAQYFDKLLIDVDEETLSPEELKERKIMKLLLKIKVCTIILCIFIEQADITTSHYSVVHVLINKGKSYRTIIT